MRYITQANIRLGFGSRELIMARSCSNSKVLANLWTTYSLEQLILSYGAKLKKKTSRKKDLGKKSP